MKILYHHRTRSRDGQAVHIESLVGALRDEGHEVVVVEPAAAAAAQFGDDPKGLSILRRSLPLAFYELLELGYNVVAYFRLRRAHRKFRPDILYERYNLFLVAGWLLRKRSGTPLLLEVNAPLVEERRKHGGLGLERLARFLERRTWQGADAVFPVTSVLANVVEKDGVARGRVTVVPNGIDPRQMRPSLSRESMRARLGLSGKIVLGFSGFVRSWHGLDHVVEFIAWSGRKNLMLLIVGDGPARAELEALSNERGVADQLLFSGIVPRDAIADHLSVFDIALQPAATSYASPLKLFEYMALGCAIVAPIQPNLCEVLRDGDNAVLFPPGDRPALFEALERLISDETLRARVAKRAMESIVSEGYTWRDNARRVVARAEAILRERRAETEPSGSVRPRRQ